MIPGEAFMNGKLIVITAPLTETIDHAGYFIQMGMASMPVWMQWVMDKKYPRWRKVEHNADGTASYMPAGVRLVEKSLGREFREDDIVACYPDDLDKFLGPNTRVVAVSTHNPAGRDLRGGRVHLDLRLFEEPINSHYSRLMFAKIKSSPYPPNFKVIVGGSGGWQIIQTDTFDELGVDCVIEGRSESRDTMDIFRKAIGGLAIPKTIEVAHPRSRDEILMPEKRTTFGVMEMTTGCGRRCQFCVPDLNPQIDVPKENIMEAVRANVRGGNKLISLATEDMFIWGQVRTGTPFFFPNREALLDLYTDIVEEPGVEQHVLSHSTMAPFVADPGLIRKLSEKLLPKSPLHLPAVSTHPQKKALCPLIGMETGSVRMAKKIMPSKGVPFPIDDWPSVLVQGLTRRQPEQLVSDDDADGRQSRRDRRGRAGHARRGLRNRAARAVCVSGTVDFHAAARHAHGKGARRYGDAATLALAVAVDPEMLEVQSRSWTIQLVGPAGLASGIAVHVGQEAAQTERSEFHLADFHVCRRNA